jgi:hypothetical protein
MYLQQVQAGTAKSIVDRIGGGFYRQFMTDCESVCGPYSFLLRRQIETTSDPTVWIEFFDEYERRSPNDDFYPLPIKWYFDVETYPTLNREKKREQLLKSVHEVCLWAAQRMDWRIEPFQEAHDTLRANGSEWSYTSRPERIPASRERLQLQQTIRLGEISLAVSLLGPNGPQVLSRIDVGTIPPQSSFNYGQFPEIKWAENGTFQVGRYRLHIADDKAKGTKCLVAEGA